MIIQLILSCGMMGVPILIFYSLKNKKHMELFFLSLPPERKKHQKRGNFFFLKGFTADFLFLPKTICFYKC